MGRVLLRAAVLLLAAAAACAPPPEEEGRGGRVVAEGAAGRSDGHAELSCAACHSGPEGQRGRATVPEAACLECHEDGGPARVRVGTAAFAHRDHGETHEIDATCAGCHTHETGEAPLAATVDACALCHIGQVAGSRGEECRVCHETPDHAAVTSQGVVVSHSTLPWVEAGCVRCHYDVADPPTEVGQARCRECHTDLETLNGLAVGRDLHPVHDGISCIACHAEGTHHVRAMSSAVELVCADCHRSAHELRLAAPGPEAGLAGEVPPSDAALCAACHAGVHRAQQQLLLGIVPGAPAAPSGKFLAGITCRSCHVPTGAPADPAVPIRGQASACGDCHESDYERILGWWLDGTRARLAAATAYVERGAATLGTGSDPVGSRVAEARSLVALVGDAGGQHNLELSDRLLRQAVDDVREAWAQAGLRAPAPPDLGRVPHMGLCSYCHYGVDEPWDMEAMSDAFHRRAMGR